MGFPQFYQWDVHPSITGCCFEHMFYVVKYGSSSWGNQGITIQLDRDEWWMVDYPLVNELNGPFSIEGNSITS